MKRKRMERVERRRALVEINLILETKPRSRPGSKLSRGGCARLFATTLLMLAALLTIWSGRT